MRRSLARWVIIGVMLLLVATAAVAWARSSNVAPDGAQQEAGRSVGLQAVATPAGSSEISYVVKRGETLAIIAKRYGLGVWDIADYNGIVRPDRIYAGQVLKIPVPVTPTPTVSCPCEEIVIISPGRGVTVTSPIIVSGVASSPFEQTVVAAVLDGSGAQIGIAPGIIVGEMGARGPFTISVPFGVPFNSQPGRIQVFTESPRDGAMEHLSSVTVIIQGLELDALLERLETAIFAKDSAVREAAISANDSAALEALMAPQFRLGGYRSEWVDMPVSQAAEMLRVNYFKPGSPRLDFSVDARGMLGDKVTWPDDVVHVVYSTGWGANKNDDAFLLFGSVDGQARWTGMLYVAHDLIDYR